MPPASFEICDLSNHPEYARRVGEIVSLWALIELRLSILFGSLLRSPPWTAWEAFFAIANAKARISMVDALVRALDHRLIERDELIQLIDRIGRAPTARNGYAHKPWVLVGGKLYQLDKPALPIEKSRKHHVTTKQLEIDIAILRTLHDDLKQFVGRFANKYLLQLEPQVSRMPQPWPGKLPTNIPKSGTSSRASRNPQKLK